MTKTKASHKGKKAVDKKSKAKSESKKAKAKVTAQNTGKKKIDKKVEKAVTARKALTNFYANNLDSIEAKTRVISNSARYLDPLSSGNLCVDMAYGGGLKNVLMVTSGKEGSGKCLVGSSLINTEHGFVPISKVVPRHDGFTPCNFQVKDKDGISRHVSHTFFERNQTTLKVTTRNGYSLEGTETHPVLVLTSNLTHEWRNLEDLKLGDFIVMDSHPATTLYGAGHRNMNKHVARLLGYLCANGQGTKLFTQDPKIRKRAAASYKKLTGKSLKIGNNRKYVLLSGFSHRFYKDLGFISWVEKTIGETITWGHSRDKYIPECILTAPKEIITEFLEAYFSCDGYRLNDSFYLSSASPKLMKQIHILLFSAYGIKGNLYKFKSQAHNSRNPKMRIYWGIKIRGYDYPALFSKAFSKAKCVVNSQRSGEPAPGTYEIGQNAGGGKLAQIPYVFDTLRSEYLSAKKGMAKGSTNYTLANGLRGTGFIKPRSVNKGIVGSVKSGAISSRIFYTDKWDELLPILETVNPELTEKIQGLLSTAYEYEEITSVKYSKSKKNVYDITVPASKSFIANGIVSHNSTLSNHYIASAIKNELAFSLFIDAEGTLNPDLAGAIFSMYGVSLDSLAEEDQSSPWRYYRLAVIEKTYEIFHLLLKKMPDKMWVPDADSWAYVFPKRDAYFKGLMDVMEVKPDRSLSSDVDFVCLTDNSKLEGAFFIDSFAAMVTERDDDNDKKSNQRAQEAQAFSMALRRVASRMTSKGVGCYGVNQIRVNPGAMFGNPEYQPGGAAILHFSAMRAKLTGRSSGMPSNISKYESEVGKYAEPSVFDSTRMDLYTYKKLKVEKNKTGVQGVSTWLRTWEDDGFGQGRGIDPYYDTYVYLGQTRQLKKDKKNWKFNLDPNTVGRKTAELFNSLPSFSHTELKTLVMAQTFSNRELTKKTLDTFKVSKLPDLRDTLFKQIETDPNIGSMTIKKINSSKDEDMDDDD